MQQIRHDHHTRAISVALVLGIAAGLVIGTARSASVEPMPPTTQALEAFVWSRVEDCHSNDGYLRCPRSPSLADRNL